MTVLKTNLDNVRNSIVFLNGRLDTFCQATTLLPDLSNIETGFDVFFVVGAVLNNPYLSQEMTCR